MDIRQLEIALSIAKNMSFSEAAWDTSVSLSSVSKQIAALESELGVRLFSRNAKSKVGLTKEGEVLIPKFQEMLKIYEGILQDVRSFEPGNKSDITIGMPNGWSTLGEDEIIANFNLEFPELNIKASMRGNTKELLHEMMEDNVDIFFTMLTPEQESYMKSIPDVEMIELEVLHLHIAVPENHPSINNGTVALKGLKDEMFLFKDNCHEKRAADSKINHFQDACEKDGFEPKMRFIDARSQTALSMVAAGKGVMPMMFNPAMKYPGVSVLPVEGDPYQFKRVVCYKKDNHSKALGLFIKFIYQ